MKSALDDTIAAIVTPFGSGGVGVVRLSGNQGIGISEQLIDNFPRHIIPSRVYHSWVLSDRKRLDEVIYYYMKAPNSYTGEDIIEINCHGGRVVLRKVLELVIAAGARQAVRGEFTRRAFLNGKLDLAQAEAVIDLVAARSDKGALAAAAQLSGGISQKVAALRSSLLSLLAEIEAGLDFPEDIGEVGGEQIIDLCRSVVNEIAALLATAAGGRVMREGARVAIVGRPNVGKSSLLNAMIEADRSIVSDQPGTTRDTVEEGFVFDEVHFLFVDTAGLRAPGDVVEEKGIARTKAEIARADLVLAVFHASAPLTAEDGCLLSKYGVDKCLAVFNKIDLGLLATVDKFEGAEATAFVSALTGEGIDNLKKLIANYISRDKIMAVDGGLINMRHEECLLRAREALEGVLDGARGKVPLDLIAIDLRLAVAALGEVSGHQVSDEVIDQIFSGFCVGK